MGSFNIQFRKRIVLPAAACCWGAAMVAMVLLTADASAWTMRTANLMTRWSMVGGVPQIDSNNVWTAYPRMQMRRPDAGLWRNLNGVWQFQRCGSATEALPTGNLTGNILVPFPIESAISGMMAKDYVYAWYRKNITLPTAWQTGKKILLHFEGVDYQAQIFVNGSIIAQHQGGYDRFTVDITRFLVNGGAGNQVLTLRVWDPTDQNGNYCPIGKQRYSTGGIPGGIFYTSTTGIWRNVWMEAVPPNVYIASLKITPVVDSTLVHVTVQLAGDSVASQLTGMELYAFAKDKQRGMWGVDSLSATATTDLTVRLCALNLWWPDRPFLYDLGIYMKKAGRFVDSVQSYFGMRKVQNTAFANKRRITINGQPIFLFGPLDQGFWPDGIYTPPSEVAMKSDLDTLKAYGMNGLRKHVKVETDYYYWLCDSIGLMVEQDMPSIQGAPSAAGFTNFNRELDSLVIQHYNHPSIVMWIVYNEGWGQPVQATVTTNVNHVMALDPTRLVNESSGWNFYPVGHVYDNHNYPAPGNPNANAAYVIQDGEFGGIRLNTTAMDAHEWANGSSWGYADQTSQAGYESTFQGYCQTLLTYKNGVAGVAGAIYTQTTDCETECNGLLTYDRALSKGRPAQNKVGSDLIVDHPAVTAVVPPCATIQAAFFNVPSIGFEKAMTASALRIAKVRISGNAITISLAGSNVKSISNLRIVNARGQKVFTTITSNAKTISVPIGTMAKGVYFVELNNGTAQQRMRCVVR